MNKHDIEVEVEKAHEIQKELSKEEKDAFFTWFARLLIVTFITFHPIDAALLQWKDGRPWEKDSWFNYWCHLQTAMTIFAYAYILTYLLWTCFLWPYFPGVNL